MERDMLLREIRGFRNGESGFNPLQVLLVAGYNYENPNEKYVVYCRNRMKHLWKINPNLKCTIYDFATGNIEEYLNSKSPRTVINNFDPITSAHYPVDPNNPQRKKYTDIAGKHIMSITDVYDRIINIGINTPKMLKEVSVFSHSYFGGPILVNSDERAAYNANLRDPLDKDARGKKDFLPANLANLKDFQQAFSTDGISWIWGCQFTKIYFAVIHQIQKQKNWLNHFNKSDNIFSFSFDSQWANDYYYQDDVFFPINPNILKFDRTVSDIIDFFQRGKNETYCQQLADASKKPCIGGLLGTYAEPRVCEKNQLWIIPTIKCPKNCAICAGNSKKGQSSNFSQYINFYKKILNMQTDKENRNYGIYA